MWGQRVQWITESFRRICVSHSRYFARRKLLDVSGCREHKFPAAIARGHPLKREAVKVQATHHTRRAFALQFGWRRDNFRTCIILTRTQSSFYWVTHLSDILRLFISSGPMRSRILGSSWLALIPPLIGKYCSGATHRTLSVYA